MTEEQPIATGEAAVPGDLPATSPEASVPEEELPLASREPAVQEELSLASREPAVAEELPKGYMSPRRAFTILALVLLIVLVGLALWLLLMLQRPSGLVIRGGDIKAGIEPVLTILGPGHGPNPNFKRPMGAALGPDGRIYVADTGNNRVAVFDGNGGFLFEFGGLGVRKPLPGGKYTWKPGRLNYPIGIAVDPADGAVYVADFRNDQIQKFDSEGRFVRAFPDPTKVVGRGSSGQDGTGIAVTDVAVAGGKVYATDLYQVLVFGTDGHLITQFGKPGVGPSDLDHPNGIAAAGDGTIYVSDSNHSRVIAFTPTGVRKWTFGQRSTGATESAAALGMPRGLDVMRDGSIIIADSFLFNLTVIDPVGTGADHFGERGIEPAQFNFANDVDALGDLLVVADKENNRVEVVRLARR